MSTQKIDNRFGVVAIEKGFIASEQLIEALKIQVSEELEGSERCLIGKILIDKGEITTDQIDEVLIAMGLL
ncbi:MAG: hypothetical protein JRJ41_12315 [Deltaproteobacteria bacterium]|nr:hypothetical protein [Deltaproteobacteria bacterium]MBW2249120.1 hypothetical protein [Deltaproteobacteria bacterium]